MKAQEQPLKLCRNSFLCNNEHILLSILWLYIYVCLHQDWIKHEPHLFLHQSNLCIIAFMLKNRIYSRNTVSEQFEGKRSTIEIS